MDPERLAWGHQRWVRHLDGWAAWAAILLGVVALVFANRQIKRNRRLVAEQTRPNVAMFMEPHPADWHVIELVVRNFGQTAAYDIRFSFSNPPTVAEYENSADGYADITELQLPRELPVLAPGQEWRMVWDSALDRAEIGSGIESRFAGTVTYYDRPEHATRLAVLAGRGDPRWRPKWCWTGMRCRRSSASS